MRKLHLIRLAKKFDEIDPWLHLKITLVFSVYLVDDNMLCMSLISFFFFENDRIER